MTLTCSHGGVKVKMKCTLHIYIVPSVDWYHHWRNRSSSFGGEANTNYYPSAKIIHKIEVFLDLDMQSWRGQGQNVVHVAHLHCSLSWLVSSWRNRSSSFGGEANTNYYPSAKIICDERTNTLITTVYLRVLVEKISPEQNTTQTIRLIHG